MLVIATMDRFKRRMMLRHDSGLCCGDLGLQVCANKYFRAFTL